MDLGIAGRRAIVNGASAGLGAASAFALAREGVELVIVRVKRSSRADRTQASIAPSACVGNVVRAVDGGSDLNSPEPLLIRRVAARLPP